MPTKTYKSGGPVNQFVINREGGHLYRAYGYYGGSASPLFVQIHTGVQAGTGVVTKPVDTTVPLQSFQVQGTLEWFELFNSLSGLLTGPLIAVVSSTEDTLTYSTELVDMWFDMELAQHQATSTVLVSSNSTGALEVWNNAAVATTNRRLWEAYIADLGNYGAQLYWMLFATDAASVTFGAKPIVSGKVPLSGTAGVGTPATGAIVLNFGDAHEGGRQMLSQGSDGTNYRGCVIALSANPTFFSTAGANASSVYAYYKTQP